MATAHTKNVMDYVKNLLDGFEDKELVYRILQAEFAAIIEAKPKRDDVKDDVKDDVNVINDVKNDI